MAYLKRGLASRESSVESCGNDKMHCAKIIVALVSLWSVMAVNASPAYVDVDGADGENDAIRVAGRSGGHSSFGNWPQDKKCLLP